MLYYIKVGFQGVFGAQTCFPDVLHGHVFVVNQEYTNYVS